MKLIRMPNKFVFKLPAAIRGDKCDCFSEIGQFGGNYRGGAQEDLAADLVMPWHRGCYTLTRYTFQLTRITLFVLPSFIPR